jgi:hypothetical protein
MAKMPELTTDLRMKVLVCCILDLLLFISGGYGSTLMNVTNDIWEKGKIQDQDAEGN